MDPKIIKRVLVRADAILDVATDEPPTKNKQLLEEYESALVLEWQAARIALLESLSQAQCLLVEAANHYLKHKIDCE